MCTQTFDFLQQKSIIQKPYQNQSDFFFIFLLRVLKKVLLLHPERRRDSSVG